MYRSALGSRVGEKGRLYAEGGMPVKKMVMAVGLHSTADTTLVRF